MRGRRSRLKTSSDLVSSIGASFAGAAFFSARIFNLMFDIPTFQRP